MSVQVSSSSQKLAAIQVMTLIIYGAVLWFAAAMLVRTLGPMGALEGGWNFLTYLLVIPGTVPAIWIAKPLANLGSNQMVIGISVVTATALLLDGIAHAWFPTLYGTDPAMIIKGAAVIFWGAGVGLMLAIIMNKGT